MAGQHGLLRHTRQKGRHLGPVGAAPDHLADDEVHALEHGVLTMVAVAGFIGTRE